MVDLVVAFVVAAAVVVLVVAEAVVVVVAAAAATLCRHLYSAASRSARPAPWCRWLREALLILRVMPARLREIQAGLWGPGPNTLS